MQIDVDKISIKGVSSKSERLKCVLEENSASLPKEDYSKDHPHKSELSELNVRSKSTTSPSMLGPLKQEANLTRSGSDSPQVVGREYSNNVSTSMRFKWKKAKEAAPASDPRDAGRKNNLLHTWDSFWGSIPRRLHFIVWYPLLVGIGLAVIIPWFQSSQKQATQQFTNKYIIIIPPPNNLTYTNINGDPINSTKYSRYSHGVAATCTLSDLDPVKLRVAVECSFEVIGLMDSAVYDDDDSEDSMFFIAPENMDKFTGRTWTTINDYWLTMQVQRDPTIVNDTTAWTFIPSARNVLVPLTPIKSVVYYPFDSYTATFELRSRLYVKGDEYGSDSRARTSRDPLAANETASFPVDCYSTFSATTISGYNIDFNGTSTAAAPAQRNGEWIKGYTTTTVGIAISRNRDVQGLAIFVSILFWLIGVGTLAQSLDYVCVRPAVSKQDDGTRASFCAVILFALPALRTVQSGIPDLQLYCTLDVCSFYLAMGMSAIGLIIELGHMTWAPKTH